MSREGSNNQSQMAEIRHNFYLTPQQEEFFAARFRSNLNIMSYEEAHSKALLDAISFTPSAPENSHSAMIKAEYRDCPPPK